MDEIVLKEVDETIIKVCQSIKTDDTLLFSVGAISALAALLKARTEIQH